jgi:flagellum-specific ATP synthase
VGEIVTSEVRTAGTHMRKLMAAFKDKEDLIAIGAYQHGTDPVVDEAIAKKGGIEGFLQQPMSERTNGEMADELLMTLIGSGGVDPYGAGDGVDVAHLDNPAVPGGGESAIPPLHLSV